MLLGRYSLIRSFSRPQSSQFAKHRSTYRVYTYRVYTYRVYVVTLALSVLGVGVGTKESIAQRLPSAMTSSRATTTLIAPDTKAMRFDTKGWNGSLLEQQTAQVQRVTANPATVSYRTLHVNAETGSDQASGIESQPLKTITRALATALPNTVIVLAPGRYTEASGEVFPLQLKPGVTIQGAPNSGDRTAVIEGGGEFTSPMRSHQNTAIIAADRAGIAQVAISNPGGYGVWVESVNPTILESVFINNQQTGLYIASGSPRVEGSYFSGNRVAGVIVLGRSTALIHQNVFDDTGDAIRVLDGATPDIVANKITNNEAGLVIIGNAQPTMRDNQISDNRRDNVVEVAASVRQPIPLPATRAPVVEQTTDPRDSEPRDSENDALSLPVIAPTDSSAIARPRASVRNPEPTISASANNNRLAVPSSSIPTGSGSSTVIFSPPSGGSSAPPAPPSRAQSLGLYYRVFVETSDPFVQDDIRSVVPDAFRTRFEGRSMMQVGAFPTEEEAEARRRLLEENNYDALVEYIR